MRRASDGLRLVAAQTDQHGNVVPRRNTVRFHFLIVQGEHALKGQSASGGPLDEITEDARTRPGPAVAIGMAVEAEQPRRPS